MSEMMLFTGSANPELAQKIVQRLGLRLGCATVSRFSDGEISIEIVENVRGKDVFVIQSTCAPTNVILTGTHPEYYTRNMIEAVQAFTDRGGRLMYLGGNGFYWVVSFNEDMPGLMECRRSEAGVRPWEPGHGQFFHGFTGEYGGLWRRNGHPPNHLCGVGMTSQGFDISEPYVINPDSRTARTAFIFDGIDGTVIGDYGLAGGGAAGLEVDRADAGQGTPDHAVVLGSSVRHTDIYLMVPEDLLDPTPDWTGTQAEIIRSDLTFFETAGGGAVFSTGSIAWAGAVAWNRYDNDIARMTENVLRRFNDPQPFEMP